MGEAKGITSSGLALSLVVGLLVTMTLAAPCAQAQAPRSTDVAPNLLAQAGDEEEESEGVPDVVSGVSTPQVQAVQGGLDIPITGGGPGLKRFDEIMVRFLQQAGIPGGALAIAKDGRLVLARGYGYENLERHVPFRPQSIICQASVSKAITGAACLKLVDQGKLNLDDTLCKILGGPPPNRISDKRVLNITVRQLLHHSAGWASDNSVYNHDILQDVTRDGPKPYETLIKAVMRSQPLDYDPGARCKYSNFQFGVLRCVIDHAAGVSYEDYCQNQVLQAMGITDIVLELPKPRYAEGEVHRYDKQMRHLPGGRKDVPLTGGLGSWVASVVDMVKFLTAMDGTRTAPFLSQKSFNAMLAPPAPPAHGNHFGLGWDSAQVDGTGVEFSKNGGVAGIKTLIVHLPNNVDFAFALNGQGNGQQGTGGAALGGQIKNACLNQRQWPRVDLFPQYK